MDRPDKGLNEKLRLCVTAPDVKRSRKCNDHCHL